MKRFITTILVTTMFLFSIAGIARADTIKYSYIGKPSTDMSKGIEATLMFATELSANMPLTDVTSSVVSATMSYTLTGLSTETWAYPLYSPDDDFLAEIATDADGKINEWNIGFEVFGEFTSVGEYYLIYLGTKKISGSSDDYYGFKFYEPDNEAPFFSSFIHNEDNPGSWTGPITVPTAPVPEPSTVLLLGIGLAGLAGFGRKKFKKK